MKTGLCHLCLGGPDESRSHSPFLSRGRQTGDDIEPALSDALGTDFLGNCQRLDQQPVGTIKQIAANRDHSQVEKTGRNAFPIFDAPG